MQQTSALPGGGSVTIDFETNFDFRNFFGRPPPPQRNVRRNHAQASTRQEGSERGNADIDRTELEPSLNNLMRVLQERGNPAFSGAGNVGGQSVNAENNLNGVRQAIADDGMLNVIQGIVGEVMGAMTGGSSQAAGGSGAGGSLTISQFMQSMPDYTYSEGDDIVTDFLMSLARVLTFRDLIGLVGGVAGGEVGTPIGESIGRLQEPMREFMRRRMFNVDDNENSNRNQGNLEQRGGR